MPRPNTKTSAATLSVALAALAFANGCTSVTAEDTRETEIDTGPQITEWMAQPAILVFSKTAAWRHNEGIAGADRYFADLATERGWGLFTTVDAGVFNADSLARFDLVIFNNVTGDVLSESQQQVFETWVEAGGAWIGLHGSGDSSQDTWEWYQNVVIGPRFIGHIMAPQFQTANVVAIEVEHPVLENVPAVWAIEDEWYSFDGVPQSYGMTAIAGLDERTYTPSNPVVPDWPQDLRMGDTPAQHPIIWSQCLGQGRLVYSAIGHVQFVYDDPNYARVLENAVDWTMKRTDADGKGCNA